jgi:hypothetical protein
MTTESEQYLDTEAAGRYLGGEDNPIPEPTMRQWRWLGRGPRYVHVGRAVRYRKSDLDAWVEARTIRPEAS